MTRGARSLLVGMAIGAVCFGLGWLLGREQPSGHPRAPGGEPPPVRESDVEIRVDAGAIRLVPDAALHLRPMKPLDLSEPRQTPPADERGER